MDGCGMAEDLVNRRVVVIAAAGDVSELAVGLQPRRS